MWFDIMRAQAERPWWQKTSYFLSSNLFLDPVKGPVGDKGPSRKGNGNQNTRDLDRATVFCCGWIVDGEASLVKYRKVDGPINEKLHFMFGNLVPYTEDM